MSFHFRRWVAAGGLLLGLPCLHGQEIWDPSFKLVGAQFSGAKEARLGSNSNWALAIEGAYPLFHKGSVAFEFGYRTVPRSTTTVSDIQREDDWSQGIYGSVLYRHSDFRGPLDGLYLQGGLRYSSLTAHRDQTTKGGAPDGKDLKVSTSGQSVNRLGPVLGLGFRFSEKLSLEINLSQAKGLSVDAVPLQKTGVLLELALGIHL